MRIRSFIIGQRIWCTVYDWSQNDKWRDLESNDTFTNDMKDKVMRTHTQCLINKEALKAFVQLLS